MIDAQLIEQLDRRRYKILFWQTVGFAVAYAGLIADPYVKGGAALTLAFTSILGAALFFTALIMSNRLQRRIKSKRVLNDALNNELVRLYRYKSFRWAFFSTLVTAVALYFISVWRQTLFDALNVCLIIIYVACLSLMISHLVYLRK